MPLTRYLIRNEYGLADPELYTAADKDDPEALLEGVAMAGLVGVLRQLGDLAEFAAEIFHNLHEEVMATAARGHGLMVRVQQLEAEFPSIEKAFLSQTNNTSFLFNTGIDWHPNLRSEQNLISSGDLPRFVMDSYEDCQGPPRLFLLDKFDVAGAGACLKRYSDPSFFLVDSVSSNTETQRETKLRKVKKKGSRWKNRETPDIGPASHVKLQQLLMEERIENGYTNPARLVKLKKRQMRSCGVDLKTGESYMEKFLETPSPEQKMVCGSSVTPPCLELTSDDIGESGFKMLEISTASDVMKSLGKDSASSSCNSQEALKRSMDNEITDGEIVKVIEAIHDNEREGGYSMFHNLGIENEAVDGEGNSESSVDGYLSDDLISEVDNYMDALNTLESELETDSECKSKQVGENITASDVNEEHLGIEAQLLDPQSIRNSSESDDGNISFLQGNSRPHCFNEVTVDDKLSHDRGASEFFNSAPETQSPFIADIPFNLVYSQDNMVKELGISSNTDQVKVSDCEVVCSNSCFSANPSLPRSNSGSSIPVALMVESAFDKTADHVGSDSKTSVAGADLDKVIAALSDDTSSTSDDTYQYATTQSKNKKHPLNDCYGGDSTVNSDILLHSQNALDLVAENDPEKKVEGNILQVDYQDKNSFGSFVDDTSSLTSSSTDKLLFTSVSPEVELLSVNELSENLPILRDFSSEAKYNDPTSMVDNSKKETEVSQEELVFIVDSSRTEILSKSKAPDEAALVELDVICSEEIKEVSSTDMNNCISNVDCVESDTPLDELQSAFPMDLSHVHENSDCYVTETIGEGSECNFSTSAFTNIYLPSSGQPGQKNDENFANVVTEAVKAEDVCDSAVDVTNTAFQAVIFDLPSTNTDDRCHKNRVDLDDVPTQAFCKNVIVPAATFPDTHGFDGVDEDIHLSLDLVSSPVITEVWEQNQSGVGKQQQNQAAINEAVCGGSGVEPEVKEKENQSEGLSLLDADCKAVFLDSNLEPDDICSVYGLVQTDQNQDSPTIDEACLPQAYLELKNLQLQETSTKIKDLSPPGCLPVLESPVGPFTEVQPNQLQMEHLEAVAAISNSSNLHESEILQSHIGRQKSEQLQSSTPGDEEQYSDTSPKSPPETSQTQLSQSESTQQGSCTSLGTGSQWSFKPSFVIVSEGEQLNLEEMPPLPPLPPMQWRLGKIQPAFPALHRKWVETSENQSHSIPLPKMDQTSEEFALQSSQGIVNPQNPFLILETGEKSNNSLGNTLHESEKSSSLRFLSMLNKPDHQNTSISLDDNPSLNPFVTIPVAHDEKLESSSGQELVHSALVPSQVSRTEGGIVKHGSQSSSTNSMEPQNESLPEPGLESKMLQQALRNLGIEEVNPDAKLEAPFIKHEQHQSLLVVEGDGVMGSSSTVSAMVSTFEEAGQPNGKLPNKIPRPRSPLIDAVATHDKRLLRKGAERVLPQVVPKVDERDSWLEQIRTKSFNLKPAVVTRPSIQGPETNLKVAAILQRANAIRQACAGSDEDDDDDSWNDSD